MRARQRAGRCVVGKPRYPVKRERSERHQVAYLVHLFRWWTPMHPKSAPRRRHSAELKAKVLAACDEPGASISGVALAHGLNANLVRKWRSGRGAKLAGMAITPAAASTGTDARRWAPPLSSSRSRCPHLPKAAARVAADPPAAAPIAEPLIQIELRRGPLHLNVRWPTAAARTAGLAARAVLGPAQVIRIDQLWLCTAPMDMRAGAERLHELRRADHRRCPRAPRLPLRQRARHAHQAAGPRRLRRVVRRAAPERRSLRVAARGGGRRRCR